MKGKRILAGLIALVMALSLAACQTGTQTQGQGSVPAPSGDFEADLARYRLG